MTLTVSQPSDTGACGTLISDTGSRRLSGGLRRGSGGCRRNGGGLRDGRPIDYRAATYAPTQVNLTNHSCPNLAGEAAVTIEDTGSSCTPATTPDRRHQHPPIGPDRPDDLVIDYSLDPEQASGPTAWTLAALPPDPLAGQLKVGAVADRAGAGRYRFLVVPLQQHLARAKAAVWVRVAARSVRRSGGRTCCVIATTSHCRPAPVRGQP